MEHGEAITESELTIGDEWLCRTCRTDIRTCARIDRLENSLAERDALLAETRNDIKRLTETWRKLGAEALATPFERQGTPPMETTTAVTGETAETEGPTWLKAEWVDLPEFLRLNGGIDTDDRPTRLRLEQDRGVEVEVFAVFTWHRGDEYAVYCDDFRTEDPPYDWAGSVEKSLEALPEDVRRANAEIEIEGNIPNASPTAVWKPGEPCENEYWRTSKDSDDLSENAENSDNAEDGDDAENKDEPAFFDEETLQSDCHDAAEYSGVEPIPDDCDVSALSDAGINHVRFNNQRGQTRELRSALGTLVWRDDRA